MNRRVLGLSGLFIIGFAVPLALGVAVLSHMNSHAPESKAVVEEAFPSAIQVNSQGVYVRVTHSPEINPREGRDFLLSAWFNLKRLPQPGKRLILLSKYDGPVSDRHGYAVALEREGESIRPAVFWGRHGRPGHWYSFAPLTLRPRNWFMLALSFYDGHILGVHIARRLVTGTTEVVLAGGYDLKSEVVPASESDLVLGAAAGRSFRGEIGPLGVFVRRDLAPDLRGILKALSSKPFSFPDVFDKREIKLWCADGRLDQAQYAHQVEVVRAGSGSRLRNKALTSAERSVDKRTTGNGNRFVRGAKHSRIGKGNNAAKAGGKTHARSATRNSSE